MDEIQRESNAVTRIALFVDVQNIYYTVREQFSCHFNYRELWRQLSDEGEIVVANAYAIERNDAGQRGFQQVLRDIGLTVKLKPFIQRSDGSAKGDWDVGIAIDVMDCAANPDNRVDKIVLLSGDGDFDLLIDRVKTSHGIDTAVYGVAALTGVWMLGRPLLESAVRGVVVVEASSAAHAELREELVPGLVVAVATGTNGLGTRGGAAT